MKSSEIRENFLNYFNKNDHTIVHSSSLIPHNDPTLMFANSGMVQFKNVFTGKEKRKYKRATTVQKCVRAGGKHNDLENVGYTSRHHTFFEMLGNFSFGDYFKEQAIKFAWDLITNDFGINKNKLLVTIFSEDTDSFKYWKKIANFEDKRIIKISSSDNFWSMGETGPCGPCSEIFYDYGENYIGNPPGSKNSEGDRFVEIWNLVFMQFEQIDNKTRINLPKPCVDTGMGLERISALLSGTNDNYKTDLFSNTIENIIQLSKSDNKDPRLPSYRVIADHLRSSCFLIADGILPSNEGRGYVLRRIMRRGMRHAHSLENKDPIFYKLVPTFIDSMKTAYPELERASSLIIETLMNEESKFKETLERGLFILNDEIKNTKNNIFDGRLAFKLYDTYGFPLDLTQDILKNENINVDVKIFNECMDEQKEKAKKSWIGSGASKNDDFWFNLLQNINSTEFVGYNILEAEGLILLLVFNNKTIDKLSKNDEGYIISNQTPFYAESGGQIGDQGFIIHNDSKFKVFDTKKVINKIYIHRGKVIKGEFLVNQEAIFKVNSKMRKAISLNHSATHILHAALRKVLGNHVTQKGSLVESERLRFDFSHNKPILNEEINLIEKIGNEIVSQNDIVKVEFMDYQKAVNSGAMALFGEKYSEEVRVVSMGNSSKNTFFSKELCGGTHVRNTGELANIKIINQTSVASGIRRIVATTGVNVKRFIDNRKIKDDIINKKSYDEINTVKSRILKLKPDADINKLNNQNDEEYLRTLKNILNSTQSNLNIKLNLKKINIEKINDIKLLTLKAINLHSKDLRLLVDESKKMHKKSVMFFNSLNDKRLSIVLGVTKDIIDRFNAVELLKICSKTLGGAGGGRADFAQGGGNKIDSIDNVIKKLKETIKLNSK